MSRRYVSLILMLVLLLPSLAHGQEMTEKYIPVGAYPEMAGKFVTTGTIVSVDERAKTVSVKVDSGIQKFTVTNTTKIWQDRSLLKEPNIDGKFSDLKSGLRAEIGVSGPEQMGIAKWVKVQIAAFR